MQEISILVVEDNPTLQKLVQLFAKKRGLRAVAVGSCEEALDIVHAGEHFAVIFMDWSLPDKNGLECTALIREYEKTHSRRVPIVAMTANMMPGDREQCLSAGMDDFIGKPFTMAEFNTMLDRWLSADESIVPFVPPEPPTERRSGTA